jgi:hypothetical protein
MGIREFGARLRHQGSIQSAGTTADGIGENQRSSFWPGEDRRRSLFVIFVLSHVPRSLPHEVIMGKNAFDIPRLPASAHGDTLPILG